jgi:choline dehydrogenase-like flavoprotein
MIIDSKQASSKIYDVCIIGAGAAGITIALELAKVKINVLLCEGGQDDYSDESQSLYQGKVVADPELDVMYSRLRYFGGTTNHWGGYCRPLDEHDFTECSFDSSIPTWPIDKAALSKYLGEACNILDIKNNFKDYELGGYFRHIDYKLSGPVRFKEKYLDVLKRSKYCELLFNGNLFNLETDGNRIREAIFKADKNKTFKIKSKFYILATGGMENSRLLLWSNKLSGGRLIKNANNLGKYWMTHPHFNLGRVLTWNVQDPLPDGFINYSPTKDFLDRNKMMNIVLRVDPIVRVEPGPGKGVSVPLHDEDQTNEKIAVEIFKIAPLLAEGLLESGYKIFDRPLLGIWEQVPDPNNKIMLSDKLDRLGMPTLEIHWQKKDSEYKAAKTAAYEFAKFFALNNLGRVKLSDWLINEKDPPVDGQEHLYGHHLGGTRMSTSPSRGIVDENCKLFDQVNMYVVGGSVFPRGGHANPTLTIVQLSLRLADHLIGKINT